MSAGRRDRMWVVGGVLAGLLVLCLGWFFLISPQSARTNDVRGRAADAQTQNLTLLHKIAVLGRDNTNLPQFVAALQQAQLALPGSSGMSDFLRTLQGLGDHTQTQVSGLTVSPPVEVGGSSPASTAAGSATGAATGSPAPGGAAGSSAAPTASPKPSTPPNPGGVSAHIYALPLTAQVSGTTAHLSDFLDQLQRVQPRAVLITQLQMAPSVVTSGANASGPVTLQLTMQVFVAPTSATKDGQLPAQTR
jgi:Tfp pilus assembly protein PilO